MPEAAKLPLAIERVACEMTHSQSPRRWRLSGLAALLAGAIVAGCAPREDRVMAGNADTVAIRFSGDVRQTLPLARQYCAQYERVPQQRDINDDIVNYACIRQ